MAWHEPPVTSASAIEDSQSFAFSGWIVQRRCATKSAEGAADRGHDLFEVVLRGRTGPSRRRTFHTEMLPKINLRYDRATAEDAHHQQQLEILGRSLT